jgi:hypothetical protein
MRAVKLSTEVNEKNGGCVASVVSIDLPMPTPDQSEYLRSMLASSGSFNPLIVVGGPRSNQIIDE